MNLENKVRITLTRAGAEYLIKQDEKLLDRDVKPSTLAYLKAMRYHEGMVSHLHLWEVFKRFQGFGIQLGGDIPFTDLELDDDKRVYIRAGLGVVQGAQVPNS